MNEIRINSTLKTFIPIATDIFLFEKNHEKTISSE